MDLIEQCEGVPVDAACDALDVSRATLYRSRRPPPEPQPVRTRAPSPRRLDDEERQRILDVLHQPEFADQPPTEVYATLLGRGIYHASIRTMYRILAEAGETGERRNQRPAQAHATPSLTATAPNQVWTWDITKLATTRKGVFLMAYVIIDLFSRFVVGWMLATKECQHLAAQLFAETIARHGVEPGLQVHADRGSAMKSDTLGQLLASLGASRSFSRPRVSDDNAFSEAQFKTLKYQPDYPGRFESELHARAYLQDFFGWHNEEHHHSSLALFTPSDVFHGRVEQVRAVRQAALDAAYHAHPERFPHGPPRAPVPPAAVHINPLLTGALDVHAPDAVSTPSSGLADAPTATPAALASTPSSGLADAPTATPAALASTPSSGLADAPTATPTALSPVPSDGLAERPRPLPPPALPRPPSGFADAPSAT
jgi:putative transposase